MLVALAAADDITQSPVAQWVGYLITPVVVVGLLIKGTFRIGSQVDKEIGRLEAALAAERAINASKDEQLSAVNKALVEQTVPALVRATMTMDSQAAELRARRD
jgi:hypothetical protein